MKQYCALYPFRKSQGTLDNIVLKYAFIWYKGYFLKQ